MDIFLPKSFRVTSRQNGAENLNSSFGLGICHVLSFLLSLASGCLHLSGWHNLAVRSGFLLRHVDDSPHLSSVFTSHSRQRQHACESPTVARAPPDIGRPVFSIVGLQRMLERVSFRELGKRFCGCAWPKSPLFIPFHPFSILFIARTSMSGPRSERQAALPMPVRSCTFLQAR